MNLIMMAFELFDGLSNLWKALITAYVASGIAFVAEITMFGKKTGRGFKERFAHSILYVSGLLVGLTLALVFNEEALLKTAIVWIIAMLVEDVDEVSRTLGVKLIPDSLKDRLRIQKTSVEKIVDSVTGTKDKDE
jgi:hypothetical protein